ncbi:PQQ-binding-like beta-propeller repeat protein [Piscinibacterium candidicorallinum]|uniref:PQQ-binding-like beta-propeller repeat protein n=1 Tax=Piscinibacterium candidicorallinum TaxID=1793872 RepID=A0ABV7H5Y1_9BURK
MDPVFALPVVARYMSCNSFARARRAFALLLLCLLFSMAGCGGSGTSSTPLPGSPSAEQALVGYLAAAVFAPGARLHIEGTGQGDWRFLDVVLPPSERAPSADHADFIVRRIGSAPPVTAQRCFAVGAFEVMRAGAVQCPGEWLQHRGDERATGMATMRLGWTRSPAIVGAWSLGLQQPLDPVRLVAPAAAEAGGLLFLQDGDGVVGIDSSGARRWRAGGLGLGEIVDVADLDADGTAEVIYVVTARINPRHASATAAGAIVVLSASSGEVLWRTELSGIEFGPNRYRATLAALGPGPGLSLLVTMTYDSSVSRFDFAGGVRNGRLRWRSEALDYDSPDKAPLVVDVDADGVPEIMIDSLGSLYALDAATGRLRSRVAYASAPTFGGFIAARDLDADGRTEIVSVSNSVYFKGYAVARWRDGALTIVHRQVWEEGLDANAWELDFVDGLVGDAIVLSEAIRGAAPGARSLLALDPLNGRVLARQAGLRVAGRLPGNGQAIAVQTTDAAAVAERLGDRWGLRDPAAGARWLADEVAGVSWAPPTSRARPSRRDRDPAVIAPVLRRTDGSLALAGGVDGRVQPQVLALPAPGPLATAHRGGDGAVLISDGQGLFELGTDGHILRRTTHSPRMFATPLVADLDGDGRAEVVAPYGAGTAALQLRADQLLAPRLLARDTPAADRESFRVPVVARASRDTRHVVLIDHDADGAPRLSAVEVGGILRWRVPLPVGNWETLIAAVPAAAGRDAIVVRDSRGTALHAGDTGLRLWYRAEVGQCQRQVASVDLTGDGVRDIVLQAGDLSVVYDGRTGASVWEKPMVGSYGGYSSVARTADGRLSLSHLNSGGLSIVTSGTVVADRKVDLARVESIAPVVAPMRDRAEGEQWWLISGAGRLARVALDGRELAAAELGLRVVVATGAFVDADDVPDLLVSTFDGELVAVSGATLRPLWRVSLGGAPGSAVVADVDGDGQAEIVVITSDGRLVLLRAGT